MRALILTLLLFAPIVAAVPGTSGLAVAEAQAQQASRVTLRIDGMTCCPDCGTEGRKVEQRTLESLLTEPAKTRLNEASDFRFWKAEGCAVVYYRERGAERFATTDLHMPVFQKSADPSRLVCYCFEHRVADIEAEVARTGTSAVPDHITEKCLQGLDRCEERNPQGACCRGNVRRALKEAQVKRNHGAPAARWRFRSPQIWRRIVAS